MQPGNLHKIIFSRFRARHSRKNLIRLSLTYINEKRQKLIVIITLLLAISEIININMPKEHFELIYNPTDVNSHSETLKLPNHYNAKIGQSD